MYVIISSADIMYSQTYTKIVCTSVIFLKQNRCWKVKKAETCVNFASIQLLQWNFQKRQWGSKSKVRWQNCGRQQIPQCIITCRSGIGANRNYIWWKWNFGRACTYESISALENVLLLRNSWMIGALHSSFPLVLLFSSCFFFMPHMWKCGSS